MLHRFVYDGRYDQYIEQDDEWEDPDPTFGVPVLAACAAILGIGMCVHNVTMVTVCAV